MSLFANLTTSGLEESQDRLGGYTLFETDIYVPVIKAAYVTTAGSGAMAVNLLCTIDGKEYKETFYVTNAKGQNYSVNDNQKKMPLPGFTVIDDICLIVAGKPLCEVDIEEKVLNVYDPDLKKEVPKSVPVLIELTGQEVALAIHKQIVNKQVKGQDGKYHDTDETREENAVDKALHPTLKFTVPEARNEQAEPKFWEAWLERNKGKVKNKVKKGPKTPSGPSSGPAGAADSKPAQGSIFGRKNAG